MERALQNRQITFPFLFILLFLITGKTRAETGKPSLSDKEKSVQNQLINQVEQDRVRKAHLQPVAPETRSELQDAARRTLHFPQENSCYQIDNVIYNSDNKNIKLKTLGYLTQQAQGKCLGIKGIRLLAKMLQDEIIRLGYITTRINMSEQNLHSQVLRFDIVSGKVGNIILDKSASTHINLKSNLPLGKGDLLTLRDLEQGSFNLQRVPGSTVKINLVPGEEKGESDIYIHREQDKFWQVGAWVNDAGSSATGRYQGGATLYLNNLTSLSDIFYVSYGKDIAPTHTAEGNSNHSIGYSIPWGYWWLDLYTSSSRYQQHIQGNWSDWMLNNDNTYYSAQLNRLLSRTVDYKTTVGLQIFNNSSRYFFNDIELPTMRKKSAGWKATLQHQRNFERTVVAGSLSVQKKMPWFSSSNTPEQQTGLVDRAGRIFSLDLQASMNFNVADRWFNYAPHFNLQLTPDRLSSLDSLALGNRWTVRGFDGESSLQENKGWYWRNSLYWVLPGKSYQPYLGMDIGQTIGKNSQQNYSGRTLIGTLAGLRGNYWNTSYDLFAGTSLKKPQEFHTNPLTLGFSLQWQY